MNHDDDEEMPFPSPKRNLMAAGGGDESPRVRKKFRPEEKPFVCDCGRAFTLKGNLTKHQKLHTNEKPFCCEIPGCGKTFTQAIGLRRHLMTHNNEKPYTCPADGCTKAFAQPGNLNAHLRIHTGEKPFVCTSCNRAFAQKGNLTTHMLYHSTEKPFICAVDGCGQAFSLKGNLKKHAKIHQPHGMDLMYHDVPGADPNSADWQMQQQKYWQDTIMAGYSYQMPEGLTEAQQQDYMQQLQYQQLLAQQQYQYFLYCNMMQQNNQLLGDPDQQQVGLQFDPSLQHNHNPELGDQVPQVPGLLAGLPPQTVDPTQNSLPLPLQATVTQPELADPPTQQQ